MFILGISCYYHDSAAALLQSGQLIAAAEEERFTRIKHDASFPAHAIRFCLRQAGINAAELNFVVVHEKPLLKFERFLTSTLRYWPKASSLFQDGAVAWMKEKLWLRTVIQQELSVAPEKILFVEHHLSHAASAFFCSPFAEAAVLTVDGVGEWATATMGVAKADPAALRLTHEMRFPDSVGLLYSTFTSYLGFEVNEGEYKVMGMAAYGEPRYLEQIGRIAKLNEDGSVRLNLEYFAFPYSSQRSYTNRFLALFGAPRDPELPFITGAGDTGEGSEELKRRNQHYADVAASVQRFTEEAVLKMAMHLRRTTGMKNCCMAGGVALNGIANMRVLDRAGFDRIFIQPAAGDAGGALGAAQYAWHVLLGHPREFTFEQAYWGEGYGSHAIGRALAGTGAEEIATDDEVIERAVEDLVHGRVVGWFQGRFEWGPRALGNRSILADPRAAHMKATVNHKIKFREPFRPFAPAVIEDAVSSLFDAPENLKEQYPARFMLLVVPWKEDAGQLVPAVNHAGTGRLQVVRREWNPRYYSIIERFGQATGIPVVLNTSFNVRGEPIVASPEDALRTFHNSGLDVLYAGNHRLAK